MISPFGIYVRQIRGSDSLRTMAKKLEITPAFLSAIEVGRKTVPLDYIDKIAKIYNLTDLQKEELYISAIETNARVNIELSKMNDEQKLTTIMFARKIINADPELIKKLRDALQDDKE